MVRRLVSFLLGCLPDRCHPFATATQLLLRTGGHQIDAQRQLLQCFFHTAEGRGIRAIWQILLAESSQVVDMLIP